MPPLSFLNSFLCFLPLLAIVVFTITTGSCKISSPSHHLSTSEMMALIESEQVIQDNHLISFETQDFPLTSSAREPIRPFILPSSAYNPRYQSPLSLVTADFDASFQSNGTFDTNDDSVSGNGLFSLSDRQIMDKDATHHGDDSIFHMIPDFHCPAALSSPPPRSHDQLLYQDTFISQGAMSSPYVAISHQCCGSSPHTPCGLHGPLPYTAPHSQPSSFTFQTQIGPQCSSHESYRKTLPAQDIQHCTAASIPLIGNYLERDCETAGLVEVPSRQERCTYPECTKAFMHKDHLNRHVRVSHKQDSEIYECPAARCSRTFKGRRDNFKSHLLLHIQAKSTRTPYDGKAAKCYDEMFLQKKKRRRTLKADRTALVGN